MHGIAERIENGRDIPVDCVLVMPDIGHRNGNIFCKSSRTVDADAPGVFAQVATAGQAVAAATADHVSLRTDDVAGLKVGHIGADLDNFTHKLVSDG